MAEVVPFGKDIKKTLEERTQQFQNLVGALQGMDGGLKEKIAEKLKEASGGTTPDYALIDQSHDRYNEKLAGEIREMIDKHYENHKLSPLGKAFDASKVDPYTREQVANIYGGHRKALKEGVGRKNFHQYMENVQRNNLDQVIQKLQEVGGAGYDEKTHGDAVVDHLIDHYKVDGKKVNRDLLKRQGEHLIGLHVTGQLSEGGLYAVGRPAYKKKAA